MYGRGAGRVNGLSGSAIEGQLEELGAGIVGGREGVEGGGGIVPQAVRDDIEYGLQI